MPYSESEFCTFRESNFSVLSSPRGFRIFLLGISELKVGVNYAYSIHGEVGKDEWLLCRPEYA